MRVLRIVYSIALVLSLISFVQMLTMMFRFIASSDRQMLEKLGQGFVVLFFATMVVALIHVLQTRRTHIERRFFVVGLMFIGVHLLIQWILRR